jgi:hypothetical protein
VLKTILQVFGIVRLFADITSVAATKNPRVEAIKAFLRAAFHTPDTHTIPVSLKRLKGNKALTDRSPLSHIGECRKGPAFVIHPENTYIGFLEQDEKYDLVYHTYNAVFK